MTFENFINETSSNSEIEIDEFYAVTDGKKFYSVSGSSHNIEMFKNDSILFSTKSNAKLVLNALPPEEGYDNLHIVVVRISAEIKVV